MNAFSKNQIFKICKITKMLYANNLFPRRIFCKPVCVYLICFSTLCLSARLYLWSRSQTVIHSVSGEACSPPADVRFTFPPSRGARAYGGVHDMPALQCLPWSWVARRLGAPTRCSTECSLVVLYPAGREEGERSHPGPGSTLSPFRLRVCLLWTCRYGLVCSWIHCELQ